MKTKKQYRNENILAAILIIISIAIIIYCRIDGMSLTEGEIFVAYWPGWMSAIGFLSAGLALLVTSEKEQLKDNSNKIGIEPDKPWPKR